jgi:hypothetical protein
MLERVVIQDLQDHECHEEKCVELVLRSVDGVIELQHASIDPVEVELYSIRTQIVLQRYRLLAVNLPNFPTHGACLGASMFSEPLRNAPFMNVLAALGFAEGKVACFCIEIFVAYCTFAFDLLPICLETFFGVLRVGAYEVFVYGETAILEE